MATTLYPADMREQIAALAATYPTPNVRRAVALAQAGTITWEQVYDLFRKSMAAALAEVGEIPQPVNGLVSCPNGCGHQVRAGVYIDPTLPCP